MAGGAGDASRPRRVVVGGVPVEIAAEVAHRTSVLPLVLAGVGHAVLPSSWTPLARAAGLRVLRIEPVTVLHVAVLSRPAHLTPAARAFLAVAAEHAARHAADRSRAPEGTAPDRAERAGRPEGTAPQDAPRIVS